jgi:GDPmannose 4,6-dehydratase
MPNSPKKALICGIGGQDGAYLARLLLAKGYQVTGTSRDAMAASLSNLTALGTRDQVGMVSMTIGDLGSVLSAIKRTAPDEIYNLAAQSSVGLSFHEPVETMQSIAMGTLHLLEAIRFVDRPIRLYSAGTSECFGDAGNVSATETTAFNPQSPYAIAKVAAHHFVANYREAYKLHACTGILFNHESSLRSERYVTKKIVKAACQIANGSTDKLYLGNINIARDWGSAEEYVEAMWRMLQQPQPEDYVIATGETNTLQDFVAAVFETVGLDWSQHVVSDPTLLRPSEIMVSRGNPAKALEKLGWQATRKMRDVIELLVAAEQSS